MGSGDRSVEVLASVVAIAVSSRRLGGCEVAAAGASGGFSARVSSMRRRAETSLRKRVSWSSSRRVSSALLGCFTGAGYGVLPDCRFWHGRATKFRPRPLHRARDRLGVAKFTRLLDGEQDRDHRQQGIAADRESQDQEGRLATHALAPKVHNERSSPRVPVPGREPRTPSILAAAPGKVHSTAGGLPIEGERSPRSSAFVYPVSARAEAARPGLER